MNGQIQQLASQLVTQQLLQQESEVDAQLQALDNLTNQDLVKIRASRLNELKALEKQKVIWAQRGHGKYTEMQDQKEWFNAVKDSNLVVCHFYRASNQYCDITDMHLGRIAPKHMETRFIKINAEKSPFVCERIGVRVMPTIALMKDNKVHHMIEGFTELGSVDDFDTSLMEKLLVHYNIIQPDDLSDYKHPQNKTSQKSSLQSLNNRRAQMIYEMEEDSDFEDD